MEIDQGVPVAAEPVVELDDYSAQAWLELAERPDRIDEIALIADVVNTVGVRDRLLAKQLACARLRPKADNRG